MAVLDGEHLWDGGALSKRHIAVILAPSGTVDSENPLVAGTAAGVWIHIYPEQLSRFLETHSECKVICHDASALHWAISGGFSRLSQPG